MYKVIFTRDAISNLQLKYDFLCKYITIKYSEENVNIIFIVSWTIFSSMAACYRGVHLRGTSNYVVRSGKIEGFVPCQ